VSRLSPEAEQLVRAGRSVLRASDADRERVLAGLVPKLGGSAGIEQESPELQRAPALGKLSAVKLSGVLVALGIAGSGIFLALRSEPQASVEVASPATPLLQPRGVPTAPAPARVPSEVSAPEPPALLAPTRSEAREVARARAPVKPRSADGLAREVALLSRAGVELHADRPAAALEALDEHQRSFPRGVLAEERAAAKVRALCALGRMKEAQAELARLTRTSPASPHLARAVQSCSMTPSEGK